MKKYKLDNEKIYEMRKKGIYVPYNFPNEKCIILPLNTENKFNEFERQKEKLNSEIKNICAIKRLKE